MGFVTAGPNFHGSYSSRLNRRKAALLIGRPRRLGTLDVRMLEPVAEYAREKLTLYSRRKLGGVGVCISCGSKDPVMDSKGVGTCRQLTTLGF